MPDTLPSFPENLIGTEFRDLYDVVCPHCAKPLAVRPSIFMTGLGINRGSGRCPGCGSAFALRINDQTEMVAELPTNALPLRPTTFDLPPEPYAGPHKLGDIRLVLDSTHEAERVVA